MRRVLGWVLGVPAVCWLAACSAGSKDDAVSPNGGGGTGTQGAGGSADLPDDETQSPNLDIGMGGAPVVPTLDIADPCLSEVRQAERVNVDLFVMLDRSGSMRAFTGDGSSETTKWTAVTSALTQFLENPETADIGVGLRVFPQTHEDVPYECFNDDECGTTGPCQIAGLCPDGSFCDTSTGCPDVGVCENSPNTLCNVGTRCPFGGGACVELRCSDGVCENPDTDGTLIACYQGIECGGALGACEPLSGFCRDNDSCLVDDYAAPDVPITSDATRNELMLAALADTVPTGYTPTTPALQGAIDYAASWSTTHPDRVAAVVLATDGFPSECLPADAVTQGEVLQPVLDAAQAGAAAIPPVRTYVIGVFSDQEEMDSGASAILQSMAVAGGTQDAFLVSTNGDATQAYQAAHAAYSSAGGSGESRERLDA
ncbi:MAG TPA: hypothetical protein VHO25_16875, partial [Polyangiaceae bacterium]|nr:hypothetical protein [Polyangiaceae bacterium]